MPRPLRLALGLALTLALASPLAASAEIIDFDPVTDTVPDILGPDELTRYNTLVGQISRPSVSSTLGPDGRYVLVTMLRLSNGLRVLDTTTKESNPLTIESDTQMGSPLLWTGPSTALALTYRVERNAQGQIIRVYDHAKTTIDFEARTATPAKFELPTIPGQSFTPVFGRPLLQTPDGRLHFIGYTAPRRAQPEVIEQHPTYDSRSREELEAIGQAEPVDTILQTTAQIVAVDLDDQSVTPIGEVPPGTSITGAAGTVSQRPGTYTVAYVARTPIPWAQGVIIGGRTGRGGAMPTSFYNTQENLGLIPEEINLHITGTSLHISNLETGERKAIPNGDHTPGKFRTPLWTADGQWLAVVVDTPSVLEGRENPIYEYSAGIDLKLFTPDGQPAPDSISPVKLGELNPPLDAGSTGLTPLDGTRMIASAGVNTARHLYIVDIADRTAPTQAVYAGDDYLFSYAMNGGKFVGVFGSVTDPGELYLGSADQVDTSREKLSESNAQLDGVSTIAYHTFSYQTSHGYTLKGTYVYPSDWPFPPPRPMPAVVWQAGGPGGQMTNTWGTSVESPYSLLPNFGIPVIVVNGAGRTSNGAKFYSDMADGRNYGQRDIQDVKEAVDYLVEMNVVDAKAVGVTGCSYGGYFTLQSVTTYPDYYAAANSQCSLNDVIWEYNFGWSPFLAYLVGNSTTGDIDEYIKDAPTYNAYKIKTPLLQFHGTDDFLPFEHITNIHDQVMANGVPSTFFRGRYYGHGIGNILDPTAPPDMPRILPNSGANGQRYAFQLQLTWFRQHLGLALRSDAAPPVWIQPLLPEPLLPQPVDPREVR